MLLVGIIILLGVLLNSIAKMFTKSKVKTITFTLFGLLVMLGFGYIGTLLYMLIGLAIIKDKTRHRTRAKKKHK